MHRQTASQSAPTCNPISSSMKLPWNQRLRDCSGFGWTFHGHWNLSSIPQKRCTADTPNLQVEVAAVPNFMLQAINFSQVSGHSTHPASNAVITPKSTQIWRKTCKKKYFCFTPFKKIFSLRLTFCETGHSMVQECKVSQEQNLECSMKMKNGTSLWNVVKI